MHNFYCGAPELPRHVKLLDERHQQTFVLSTSVYISFGINSVKTAVMSKRTPCV
jgi:hypothetical protein